MSDMKIVNEQLDRYFELLKSADASEVHKLNFCFKRISMIEAQVLWPKPLVVPDMTTASSVYPGRPI